MGRQTGIEWCDHTFNPWWGCTKISPACKFCYADSLATRWGHKVWGDSAPRRFFGDKHWRQLASWNAAAERDGVQRKVFCGSMCDIMERRTDLQPHRERLYDAILDTPYLIYLLLTKRPENFAELLPEEWVVDGCPENVWLMTTVESFEYCWRAEVLRDRAPHASVKGLSCEPLLSEVDPRRFLRSNAAGQRISWIITGHESGPGARATEDAWTRHLRDCCQDAGAAFFYKQANRGGIVEKLPLLDGMQYAEFPTPQMNNAAIA